MPPHDVDALVASLEDLLATSIETLEAMGQAAYVRVLERHAIDTEAGKLARLFKAGPQAQQASVPLALTERAA
ncbi:hypothetical protein LP419_06405 [Massilia sp. H-1]|nr:hypothetical protein LP419_06405 [Massilia sp. H-1]